MVIDIKNSNKNKNQKCITSQKYYGPCLQKIEQEKDQNRNTRIEKRSFRCLNANWSYTCQSNRDNNITYILQFLVQGCIQ